MFDMEKVEKLKEKTGISYEEAKAVLQETGGDLLDAFILLEQRGTIPPAEQAAKASTSSYTQDNWNTEETYEAYNKQSKQQTDDSVSFGELVGRFFSWVGKMIQRGNQNSLHVTRSGEDFISVPVTLLVIFLLLAFWVVFPLLIIGLFCGFRYQFSGPDLGTDRVNRTMDTVSEQAQQAVHNVKHSAGDFANDVKKGAGQTNQNDTQGHEENHEENNTSH